MYLYEWGNKLLSHDNTSFLLQNLDISKKNYNEK